MAKSSIRKQWARHLANGGGNSPASRPAVLPMKKPFRGVVLGIDPSLRGMGLAVIDFQSSGYHLRMSQTLKLHPKHSNTYCLGQIAHAVIKALDEHTCDAVAVEETIYVQNFRTAQILGAARGAAIAIPAMRDIALSEYPPLRIKQAVAGYGRASKEQIARQVQALLQLPEALPFDESDAAAVALCHALTTQSALT